MTTPNQTPPSPSLRSGEETVRFFEKAEKIYPRRVKGKYRNLKWLAMIVTLGIYYLAPFIRWDRGPNAPDQAILIDLPHRRAYWFFIEIWPQEVYYIAAILIFAAVALFFITSLFGRVWCGYFCPQTVWTDLFVWVERVVQGDRHERKKLNEGAWTFKKVYKLSLTYLLWFFIAWWTAGSFVLYFNDAPTLVHSFFQREVSSTVMLFMSGLTFSTFLMAGLAREQVCIYMCPYSRFQSAMFDRDTLIIGYDTARGEPRGKHKKGESWQDRGHCIDCMACVQVCPMGIDIRKGLQIDCIACGLCIDACNDIMDKVELPRGLIRYDSENRLEGRTQAFRFRRPRTFYYLIVLTLVAAAALVSLINRSPIELGVMHDRNPLFVSLSNGNIRNGYEIHILNKSHDAQLFDLHVEGLENETLDIRQGGAENIELMTVEPDNIGVYHVFISAFEQSSVNTDIKFVLTNKGDNTVQTHKSIFISGEEAR